MRPGKEQFPEKKYWSQSERPEYWVVARHSDEARRERLTRDISKMSAEKLGRYNQREEASDQRIKSGSNPAAAEVSGDALARLKAGKPAKTDWDIKRD